MNESVHDSKPTDKTEYFKLCMCCWEGKGGSFPDLAPAHVTFYLLGRGIISTAERLVILDICSSTLWYS